MSLNYLICVVILQGYLQLVSGYRQCGSRTCTDGTFSIAYCCRGSFGNKVCCYHTKIWSSWYLWFGLVIFFLLLASCIAAYRRRENRLRMQQTRPFVQTTTVTTTNTTVSPSYPPGQINPTFVARPDDLPPSYEQIQKQGIDAQYQNFAKLSSEPEGVVPSYQQQLAPPNPPQPLTPQPSGPPYPTN